MNFKQVQTSFMSHIRDPQHYPDELGLEDRRLKIYRELFFNNIKGFLSSAFPVLESILGEQHWEKLSRNFFANHDCRSPYFLEISKEFVEFLSNSYELQYDDYPFMFELAHYEWIELELSTRKQTLAQTIWDQSSDYSSFKLSEMAELLSYEYPVHQISQEYLPDTPAQELFYLIVSRDENFEVSFTQINAVTAHLVQQIGACDVLDLVTLQTIMCQALSHLPKEQIENATTDIVESLLKQQILVIDA